MKAYSSKKQYYEALRNISMYPLPVYTIKKKKYVPVENALMLKEFADDVLHLRKKKEEI